MCDVAHRGLTPIVFNRGLAPSMLLHAKAFHPQGICISMKARGQ
jgi:hypothetical protein